MNADKTLFGQLEATIPWSDAEWGFAVAKTRRLFNPSSPIDEDALFSGRIRQVGELLGIIYERGAHAVIYGERGVGKSSLANTIASKLPISVTNIKFLKENCRPEDTYFTLWSKMLWEVKFDGVDVSEYLKDEKRHFVVTKIIESLPKGYQYVFVFDEFDRISSPQTKMAMADTIKHFSDYPQNITIVIVGVGFSIDELFGAHPSIQRCCRQIPMPRMSRGELAEIITERYPEIGIDMDNGILDLLVSIAQGLPGFIHLAGREAVLSAIARKSRRVERLDYDIAVRESVGRAQESIISAYRKAIYSTKDNIYREVLLACALARKDEQEKFAAADIREELAKILKRKVTISSFARHLAAFCNEERGPVLRKTGKPKGFQYQFVDAPLQPYVIMAGKRDKLI